MAELGVDVPANSPRAGNTDLAEMLRSLRPEVRPGEFVYASIDDRSVPAGLVPEATIREAEGLTVVLRRQDADANAVAYDFVAGWITLTVHSSLEAVGLTAAFSSALGHAEISCNVLAGYHHDHLLVPIGQLDAALAVLNTLCGEAGRDSDIGGP